MVELFVGNILASLQMGLVHSWVGSPVAFCLRREFVLITDEKRKCLCSKHVLRSQYMLLRNSVRANIWSDAVCAVIVLNPEKQKGERVVFEICDT